MANRLLERLRQNDKKGFFKPTQASISYQTGFAPLDYRNGYMIQVRDLNEKLIKEYPAIGVVGGTFITIISKSGVGKTTFATQVAANIVRPYENAFVHHHDIEQTMTYTRVKNITGFSHAELDEKYIIKQERTYIEDIFDSIMAVAKEKEANKNDYMYDTGLVDEFNRPIYSYVPTVEIIDSIPTLATRDTSAEMEGGTYSNRVAKAISQFYKRLMPVIKTYNITVIAINHINSKIEINPMLKTQPQLLYMKMDESIPGGNAPIYYAHNLFKFIAIGSDKYTLEDDGFDGVTVRCELLKSRTNKAGQFCNLVFNQITGFDPIMTQLKFAIDNELVEGRNPYRYITGYKDIKFDTRKFRKEFLENEQLRFALYDKTVPILTKQLSRVDPDFTPTPVNYVDLIEKLDITEES